MAKPNILLVMADQINPFVLKAYGGTVCKTPVLDAMVEEATVFENAYCSYPLCAPSRFSMMTGRMPSRLKAYDNGAEMPASTPTIAHYLRLLGYATSLSGKMHFIGPDQYHGFEERLTTEIYPADYSWTPMRSFDEPENHSETAGVSTMDTVLDAGPMARTMQLDYDEDVTHAAVKELYHLARADADRPFFLTVSFSQPHDPYITTRQWWDLYEGGPIDSPQVPFVPLEERDAHSRSLYFHYSQDKAEITTEVYSQARRAYYGMLSYIDYQLGRLIQVLGETGQLENTIIVFTSDHGDMIGERGMWFKKTLFEPAVRVPLIIWQSAKKEAEKISQPVSLVDVLPTLYEFAGGAEDEMIEVDGSSLLPLIGGKSATHPTIFCEHIDGATLAPRIMMREGKWKLVVSEAYPSMLFNLEDDALELDDLAKKAEFAEILSQLNTKLLNRYDLADLKQTVLTNQKKRRFIEKAVQQGKAADYTPRPRDRWIARYVRRGDDFPGVEQRGYLLYRDMKKHG